MGLIASLDIGNETIVMAMGNVENHLVHLEGIKCQASQGVERGVIKDWDEVEASIRILASELLKDKEVDTVNMALSGAVLKWEERRVRVNLQKKTVERGDLYRSEQRCYEMLKDENWIDIIPIAYAVDQGEWTANPLGHTGRELEVVYRLCKVDAGYLSQLQRLFDHLNWGEVCLWPAVRSYGEVLPITEMKELALLDIGAMGIHVALFRNGLLANEAYLPLGDRTIDYDIMYAYHLNFEQARKLKYEHGEALRSICKNKKVQIPGTNYTLESRDLATIIQSRSEELLEGAIALLQSWGYVNSESKLFLTGGGARLKNIDILLQRLFGHPVEKMVVRNIQTSRGDVLRTPEYAVALGLLKCNPSEVEERSSFVDKLVDRLKGMFR